MRPWHRLDLVLEVMAQSPFAAVHLVLAGQGPALAQLLEQARALGLQDRVHALGAVPGHLLPAHVCAFDAALIPAINAYASPLKLFDSLAAGIATLAPDQPNLRETLVDGDNGLLFEAGSAEALAARLLPLVEDHALCRRIGASGRQSLIDRGWTWDDNARRIGALAEELLGAARASVPAPVGGGRR